MSIAAIQERIAQIQSLRAVRFRSIPGAGSFQTLLDEEIQEKTKPDAKTVRSGSTDGLTAPSHMADALGSLPPAGPGDAQVGDVSTTLPWGAYRSAALPKIIEHPGENAGTVTYSGQADAEIRAQAQPYLPIIEQASSVYGVPANVIMAVIKRESDFSQYETSHSGAMGFMQNMPFNCEDYGVTEPYDPYQNIMCGTWQIGTLLDMYDGDLRLALAGFAIGCGTLRRAGVTSSDSEAYRLAVPAKTQAYVEDILRYAGITS